MRQVGHTTLAIRSALPDAIHLLPTLEFTDTGQLVGRVPVFMQHDSCTVLIDWSKLPVRANSITHIDIGHLPEFVQEDTLLLEEVVRVLRPEGVVTMTLANAHSLFPFEGVNTYRYLRDITRHGKRPLQTLESGWRRTYSREDIDDLMMLAGLTIVSIQSAGFGFDRATTLASLIHRRWLGRVPSATNGTLDVRSLVDRFDSRFQSSQRGSVWKIRARTI